MTKYDLGLLIVLLAARQASDILILGSLHSDSREIYLLGRDSTSSPLYRLHSIDPPRYCSRLGAKREEVPGNVDNTGRAGSLVSKNKNLLLRSPATKERGLLPSYCKVFLELGVFAIVISTLLPPVQELSIIARGRLSSHGRP